MKSVELESAEQPTRQHDLMVYLISVGCVLIATVFKAGYQAVVGLTAAKRLHDLMTHR